MMGYKQREVKCIYIIVTIINQQCYNSRKKEDQTIKKENKRVTYKNN